MAEGRKVPQAHIERVIRKGLRLKKLEDFSKARKGRIYTYIPQQQIDPTNPFGFMNSGRPKLFKVVVKEVDGNEIVGEVHLAKFETKPVKFKKDCGNTHDGYVINKKFKGDWEYLLGLFGEFLDLRIHLVITGILYSKLSRNGQLEAVKTAVKLASG